MPAESPFYARVMRWETLIVGLIAVAWVVGGFLSSDFYSADSFTTASLDLSEVALMALPLALVVVAAEIDLSVASVLALSSACMGELWNAGQPIPLWDGKAGDRVATELAAWAHYHATRAV